MLTELIQTIKDKGLSAVAPLRLDGTSKAVFDFLVLIQDTDPEETDKDWWELRLWLKRN